jgi:hypothetical protein
MTLKLNQMTWRMYAPLATHSLLQASDLKELKTPDNASTNVTKVAT